MLPERSIDCVYLHLQARRAAELLSDTASAASHVLAGLGEAAATRLLECTRRLALSTPQAQLLRVGGDCSDVAGGSPPHNSSRWLLQGSTMGGGSGSMFGTAGRMMTGGTPKQTDRPLLLLQDASARGGRGEVEGSSGREGSRSASPYGNGAAAGSGRRGREGSARSASPYGGMGAAGSTGGPLRGLASGSGLRPAAGGSQQGLASSSVLWPAAGGSRFLTDPAGWMKSDAGAAVDDDDAATLLLSRRQQQQQQLSRGPRSSRGDSSLLSPRRQQLLSAARSFHSLRREGVAAEVDAAAGIGADPRLGELRKKVRCARSVEWCYKSGRKNVRRHPAGEGEHWQGRPRFWG